MPERAKVGVVGAGNMGANHIRNYGAMGDIAELTAFTDPNPETQELANRYGIRRYDNYEAMVLAEQLDAVTIATPTPTHFEIAKHMITNGIHVLIEKPVAHTVEEADQLIELARSNDVIAAVGHIERFNPVVRELRRLIIAGDLGKISAIDCVRVGGFPSVEPSTDVVTDLAIHDIDVMHFLTGKDFHVVGSHGSRTIHTREIDSVHVLLASDGIGGTVVANWITPAKVRTLTVTGSQAYITADYITQDISITAMDRPFSGSQFDTLIKEYGQGSKNISVRQRTEPLSSELRTFLSAILRSDSMQAEEEIVTLEDGREALRLALTAKEMAEERHR